MTQVPEIIRAGVTGRIFKAGDIADFASKIRSPITDCEKTREMSVRGIEMVRRHHSAKNMLATLLEIHSKYLGLPIR
jgi:hypothetical protein